MLLSSLMLVEMVTLLQQLKSCSKRANCWWYYSAKYMHILLSSKICNSRYCNTLITYSTDTDAVTAGIVSVNGTTVDMSTADELSDVVTAINNATLEI